MMQPGDNSVEINIALKRQVCREKQFLSFRNDGLYLSMVIIRNNNGVCKNMIDR